MAETKTFPVRTAAPRLDKFLTAALKTLSRSYVQKLIKDGLVSVGGRPETAGGRPLVPGETVAVALPDFSGLPAADADVPVLFEDAHLVVVDKPAGWVVHPAGPHQADTLVQRLWPKLAAGWAASVKGAPLHTARPGVVHRLDKGTSGVILVAKTPAAAEALSAQFLKRTVQKTYWALVKGAPATAQGVVKSTVGRDRRRPHRMSVTDPGRPSELAFKVLGRFSQDSLLEVRPRTGRTHQIRVQLASLGHPLLGDATYGGDGTPGRPMLHALSLAFDHPATGKRLSFAAPLPADFRQALAERGFDGAALKKLE